MTRRALFGLLGLGVAIGLAWIGYGWWRSEAVATSYHAVRLGMSLDEAERVLGLPRNHVGEAYSVYEDVHLAEDEAPRNASEPVCYRDSGYLVIINYDPTATDGRVHRKELVRVRHDWVRRLRDSLP